MHIPMILNHVPNKETGTIIVSSGCSVNVRLGRKSQNLVLESMMKGIAHSDRERGWGGGNLLGLTSSECSSCSINFRCIYCE